MDLQFLARAFGCVGVEPLRRPIRTLLIVEPSFDLSEKAVLAAVANAEITLYLAKMEAEGRRPSKTDAEDFVLARGFPGTRQIIRDAYPSGLKARPGRRRKSYPQK